MAKKESYCLDLLAGLSKFFYLEEIAADEVLSSFLDLLTKELGADYAFLVSSDGNRTYNSARSDIAVLGHYKDEAWIQSASENKQFHLSDLPQSLDGELRDWEVQQWGKLLVKFPDHYRQRAILDEMDQVILFLSIFMHTVELRSRERLVSSLTSDLRKTMRPDLALEKISTAMQEFLGSAPVFFFKKLPAEDARGALYELIYPQDSSHDDNGLPRICSFQEIQNFSYFPTNFKAEIFESKVRDKVWGLLVVAKPTRWLSMHKAVIKPFAEQLGTIFNQNELHNESLSMAQREFLLNQITTTIRDSLDIDQIIKITAQEIAQVMGVDACGIIILNRRMRGSASQSSWSPNEDLTGKMDLLLKESVGTVYAPNVNNPSVNIGDFSSESADVARFFSNDLGLKSYLACGLYRDNGAELIGVISVALYNQKRNFTEGEQQLLEAIAKQVEMALMQAAIYQESQQTKRQMALLHKLSSDIRNSLDLSVVLGQIASGLGEVLGLSRCFVRRLSIDNKVLKTEQEYCAPGVSPCADIIFGFERAWISKIAQTGTSADQLEYLNMPYVKSLLEKESQSLAKIADSIQLKSYLSVPLIARGKVLGTINVHQCDRERSFMPEEIEFISRVGSEAAVAIEHAELFDTIDKLNKTDPDTGLYNKRYFRIVAERETSKAMLEKRDISFMMVDLDHLKEINDTYGHDAGDEAIMQTAKVLENTLRQTPVDELRTRIADVVGRYGGDEFMVLLPDTSLDSAEIAAQRVRTNLAKVSCDSWGGKPLTCSIGIAGTPDSEVDFEVLKKEADKALYLSKSKGRDAYSSSREL